MYKVAVMGDYDSIYGFATVGLDTFSVSDVQEAEKRLHDIAAADYAVIFITEDWAAKLSGAIETYNDRMTPAIIPIPGISGDTGAGVKRVKKFVETAVGSDILFSNNE